MKPTCAWALLLPLLAACAKPPPSNALVPPLADGGCWVRLFEQPGFGEPIRLIDGPTLAASTANTMVQVPDIENIGVQPLLAEARSLETGPGARLVGYSDTMFRGETSEIGPGTRVPDAAAVGYPQRFASFKVHCRS